MKRSSILVKISRILQKLPIGFFRVFEWPFLFLGQKHKKANMIFIVALPRSGSTLTYQLLCHSLNSHYLSNVSLLLYKLPLFGGLLSDLICKRNKSDFKSEHGLVSGLSGPAEGLQFWKYWFGCGLIEETTSVASCDKKHVGRRRYLKKVFKVLSSPSKPVITGFLGHSICIKELMSEYPSAIYIKLRRNPVDNAVSLLKSKRANGENWFSVLPAECDATGDCEFYNVASQVFWLNKKLEQLKGDRVFSISYEELCKNPRDVVSMLVDFANSHGLDLQNKHEIPPRFSKSDQKPTPEANAITSDLINLQRQYGTLEVYNKELYLLSSTQTNKRGI